MPETARSVLPAPALAVALAVLLALSGCDPTVLESSAPSSTRPGGSPTPTDVPARALPAPGVTLSSGRYVVANLGPVITFEVEDAVWVADEPSDGLVVVVRAVAPGSQRTITLRFARPVALHAGPDSVQEPAMAAEAVATLRDNPSLIHLGSSPGVTGGVSASVIEIEGVGAETWPVLQTAGATLELADGRRMWISFSDWPDGLLAIVVEGAAADWDRDLRIVEPVLESVTLGR